MKKFISLFIDYCPFFDTIVNCMTTRQKIYLPFKRLIDIIGAILGIILVGVLVWLWVIPVNAIVTKGHPFFVQKRIGKKKKVFKMIKFRSMRLDANPNLAPSDMKEGDRKSMETKFGKFLRVTSIDETPQLLNIFVGQMSFIGPRPGAAENEEELIRLRESYTPNAYDVKPGLGGYAQVKLKRDHDPAKKAECDHVYAKKMNIWFDIGIFFRTIFTKGK